MPQTTRDLLPCAHSDTRIFFSFRCKRICSGKAAPGIAEVERVIVTGSNIPTAEETGPNPVDTYPRQT